MNPTLPVEEVDLPRVQGIAVRATLPVAELPRFFAEGYGELFRAAAAAGAQVAGAPFARYLSITPEAVEIEAVMPVTAAVPPAGRVYAVDLPAGHAAQAKHVGPYEDLAAVYQELDAWIAEHHRCRAGATREVYLTDPSVADPARYETLVIQPII